MIQGSAGPGPSRWLQTLCEVLVVGLDPHVPRVAFDGLRGRDAAPVSSCEASFLGSAITRWDGGDFVADGWGAGMAAAITGSAFNDGERIAVSSVTATTLTFTRTVQFASESPTEGVSIAGSTPDGFALYYGAQHLDRWTGADVATIVAAEGNGASPFAQGSHSERTVLGQYAAGFDVHIWAAEVETADIRTLWHDVVDHVQPGFWILENILRAAYAIVPVTTELLNFTWTAEPSVMRYGEAMVARLNVGAFPILDFAPLPLQPAGVSVQWVVKRPGEA